MADDEKPLPLIEPVEPPFSWDPIEPDVFRYVINWWLSEGAEGLAQVAVATGLVDELISLRGACNEALKLIAQQMQHEVDDLKSNIQD